MQKQTPESVLFNLFLTREKKGRMREERREGEKEQGKLLYMLATCYEATYM